MKGDDLARLCRCETFPCTFMSSSVATVGFVFCRRLRCG